LSRHEHADAGTAADAVLSRETGAASGAAATTAGSGLKRVVHPRDAPAATAPAATMPTAERADARTWQPVRGVAETTARGARLARGPRPARWRIRSAHRRRVQIGGAFAPEGGGPERIIERTGLAGGPAAEKGARRAIPTDAPRGALRTVWIATARTAETITPDTAALGEIRRDARRGARCTRTGVAGHDDGADDMDGLAACGQHGNGIQPGRGRRGIDEQAVEDDVGPFSDHERRLAPETTGGDPRRRLGHGGPRPGPGHGVEEVAPVEPETPAEGECGRLSVVALFEKNERVPALLGERNGARQGADRL
jgi:hypothetical protein